ncbi:Chromosome segregation protein Spo0J, contains ParB-like nuclease domain [Streptomyces sp. 1222.5]|uniref:transcriptional regulator n=1 Tax=unclassified Streptomyces TaxID=2593676 RepID=UPI00089C0B78|nr:MULTISPECIES: transcriptional regulator [unclassified Streptomyces]PKW08066.1 ParB-like chromosome segregation protein Spo0J [Streptomyces sp. 5112.2]SEC72894.1 Chromosome segregation protein Spo0J, contains ParB-like nuclease domain [Streptomyces sp. 1222.5]
MPTDFGVPPTADEIRAQVEQRLQDARSGVSVPETLRVEFRGRPIHVEVIDMPVDRLYYNPATHRVSAQRAYDPAREEALTKDHWSEAGQGYLHELLMAKPSDPHQRDPDFEKLKQSLQEHRQNEPGLISRDGVLVNGNTRRAALRELGIQSIRVGVLPASCTWDDIRSVELSLQLRPDRRREYSYINRLMAVEEQIQQGLPLAAIAKLFHTSTPALERDTWVLGQLRDLVKRSEHGQTKLRLMDFEDAQERFAELYRAYVKEKARDKEKADTLLEYRLAAIVLDVAKTDIRFIRTDFRENYLAHRLPEGSRETAPEPPKAVSIPGLNRTVPGPSSETAKARALTDSLLRAKATQKSGTSATPEEMTEANRSVSLLEKAFDESIQAAQDAIRKQKKRLVAPDRIIAAVDDLQQCVTDLALARGNNSLDEGAFDDTLIVLRQALAKLSAEASRSIQLPGEGLAWLREAVADQR